MCRPVEEAGQRLAVNRAAAARQWSGGVIAGELEEGAAHRVRPVVVGDPFVGALHLDQIEPRLGAVGPRGAEPDDDQHADDDERESGELPG